jgi:hypothetical protein
MNRIVMMFVQVASLQAQIFTKLASLSVIPSAKVAECYIFKLTGYKEYLLHHNVPLYVYECVTRACSAKVGNI